MKLLKHYFSVQRPQPSKLRKIMGNISEIKLLDMQRNSVVETVKLYTMSGIIMGKLWGKCITSNRN